MEADDLPHKNAARWTDTSTDCKVFTIQKQSMSPGDLSISEKRSHLLQPVSSQDDTPLSLCKINWSTHRKTEETLLKAKSNQYFPKQTIRAALMTSFWLIYTTITESLHSSNNWQRSYSTSRFNWETPSQANMQTQNINRCKPWLFWNNHRPPAGTHLKTLNRTK